MFPERMVSGSTSRLTHPTKKEKKKLLLVPQPLFYIKSCIQSPRFNFLSFSSLTIEALVRLYLVKWSRIR